VSLGGPGAFKRALLDAGFGDVRIQAVPIPGELLAWLD
jgi:hypothetical protein